MLHITDKWSKAIAQPFRYPGHMKISIDTSPPGILQDVARTSFVTSESGSTDGLKTSESFEGTTKLYSEPRRIEYRTLEVNRWLLDGSESGTNYTIPAGNPPWSGYNIQSSSDMLICTIDLGGRWDLYNLTFVWDIFRNSYPQKLQVIGYGGTTEYGEPIEVLRVDAAPEGVTNTIDFAAKQINKLKIKVSDWSIPGWHIRWGRVIFGGFVTISTSDEESRIMSAEYLNKSSALAEELPTYSMKLTLRNDDLWMDPLLSKGISAQLKAGQHVTFNWGFEVEPDTVEWTPDLLMFINTITIPTDSTTAVIDTFSRIRLLDENFDWDDYVLPKKYSLGDLAYRVLDKAAKAHTFSSENIGTVSSVLYDIYTTAPIPSIPSNQVLQYLANLAGCWLTYNLESGEVVIAPRPIKWQDAYSITGAQTFGDPSYTFVDALRTLTIQRHTYTWESSREIARAIFPGVTERTEAKISFNGTLASLDAKVAISGGTLNDSKIYRSCAIVTFTPSSSSTDVTITITGQTIRDNTTAIEVYRNDLELHGLDVVVDNPFVTEATDITAYVEYLLAWYNKRSKVSMQYTGYPELESGDTIKLTTKYTGTSSAEITGSILQIKQGFISTHEETTQWRLKNRSVSLTMCEVQGEKLVFTFPYQAVQILSNSITFNGAFRGKLEVR